MKIINAAGLMSLVLFAVCWQPGVTAATKGPRTERVVDANGNLRVPVDYRTAYAAGQGQGSKEIHVVYTSPGTIATYRKDGRFPDGSVLVKEVFEATTGAMTIKGGRPWNERSAHRGPRPLTGKGANAP
jgi:Cytochrome P460